MSTTATKVGHTPGPWKLTRIRTKGKLSAVLVETTAPNQPHNDPCVIAIREDWLGFIELNPQGQANMNLIAAAPDMLEALEYAAEIIKVARGYFPKSVSNRDRFDLENTNAAINKAIARAKGGAV